MALLIAGTTLRRTLRAQTAVDCVSICSSVPEQEREICINACAGAQASAAAASQSSSESIASSSAFPSSLSSTDSCAATTFRQQETGFCILAHACRESPLLRRGFARSSCSATLDLTHMYRRPGEHPAAPEEQQLSIKDIALETTSLLGPLLGRIPQDKALYATIENFRGYLAILHASASARTLTDLETEATAQYLRLRILDIVKTLKDAGIAVDDRAAEAQGTVRQSIVEELAPILYTLLPRLFENIEAAQVPGLDVPAARTLHGSAAALFDATKESCALDTRGTACFDALQKVLGTLDTLKQFLAPHLLYSSLWEEAEQTLTLDQFHSGAIPTEGFPRPSLEDSDKEPLDSF